MCVVDRAAEVFWWRYDTNTSAFIALVICSIQFPTKTRCLNRLSSIVVMWKDTNLTFILFYKLYFSRSCYVKFLFWEGTPCKWHAMVEDVVGSDSLNLNCVY